MFVSFFGLKREKRRWHKCCFKDANLKYAQHRTGFRSQCLSCRSSLSDSVLTLVSLRGQAFLPSPHSCIILRRLSIFSLSSLDLHSRPPTLASSFLSFLTPLCVLSYFSPLGVFLSMFIPRSRSRRRRVQSCSPVVGVSKAEVVFRFLCMRQRASRSYIHASISTLVTFFVLISHSTAASLRLASIYDSGANIFPKKKQWMIYWWLLASCSPTLKLGCCSSSSH